MAMITFEEAFQTALNAVRPMGIETIPLTEACGRILAQEIVADMAMPPFNRAMVDGFACRRCDLEQTLLITETIAAGYFSDKSVHPGECVQIMTGAPVPDGADCVFMVEHSEQIDDTHVKFVNKSTNDNIATLGEDVQPEDLMLQPGHMIRPQDIAILASMGYPDVLISQRPRVGVIATGDELVEPSMTPTTAQIRNSNAYALCAQVNTAGCISHYEGVARDNEASLREIISAALDRNDVVLLSGGVSMGKFDLVPGILKEHGIDILYDRVAVQPGKPTTFGLSDQAFCWGLPGNPVATFTIFELVVKAFLYRMMGHDYTPPTIRMPLAEDIKRRNSGRTAWIPVTTTPKGELARVAYHGSAHINAMSYAEGLIPFPEGHTELPKGTLVNVRLIR